MGFHRMAGWCGLAAVALMALGGAAGNAGGPPSPVAPAPRIAAHFAAYGAATLLSAYANVLAAVALLVFASGLWCLVRAARRDTVTGWNLVGLLGAVAVAMNILSVSAVQMALPLSAATSQSPDTVQGLFSLWNSWVMLIGVAAVPLLVGFGLAGLRSRLIPPWLAGVGFVGAAAGLIGAFPVSAFIADSPLGGLVALVGLLQYPALFLWLLAASISVLRRGRPMVGEDSSRTLQSGVST